MKHLRLISQYLLVLLTAGGLIGCSSSPVSDTPPDTEVSTLLKQYHVGIGDNLRVDVWKNPEISGPVVVRPDGKITLPLVGDVMAMGKTTEDLSQMIEASLDQYLRNPKVAVILQSASSADFMLRVRITGAVSTQLSIPYRQGMTVMDLVLQAGGLEDFASANKAKLYRTIDGEVKIYPVRIKDILNKGKLETNYTLIPSDVITVPERIL